MRLRLTPAAQYDIDGIYQHHAKYSEQFALRVENAIFHALAILEVFPQIGVRTDLESIRRWPMPLFHYAVFYRISIHEDLDVLRVIDGRRLKNVKRVP